MVKATTLISGIFGLILLCSPAGLLLAQPSSAFIKLTLDSSEIFLGDTVVLEVESTGLLDPIDLTPLEQHATLVRETTGTKIAVINGKVVEIAIRRMDLTPQKHGLLVFGPLLAGSVASNSVHINILNATRPDWQPLQDDLQIKTMLEPESLSVNQQAVLTIELLHRYPISNESVTLPDLSGFSTRLIIDKRRTFKGEDKAWYRTQWRYLVFPTRSGNQQIGEISWSGTTARSRIERAAFSRNRPPLNVLVQPAIGDSENWWLPASELQLNERWSAPVTELRAGDELERVITLAATGVLAGQLPTPDVPESRALKQTLISSTREESIEQNSITSTAKFTYRVKAQSPIPVFLDTVRIPWWNTITGDSREAIIPARRINVGLPDRANLPGKIALQETGVTRIRHWLQSTTDLRLAAFIAAGVCSLLLVRATFPAFVDRLRHRWSFHRHVHTLRTLAIKGDSAALYRALTQQDSEYFLAGINTELKEQLHKHLFAPASGKNSRLPTDKVLRQLGNARYRYRSGNQPRQANPLPGL